MLVVVCSLAESAQRDDGLAGGGGDGAVAGVVASAARLARHAVAAALGGLERFFEGATVTLLWSRDHILM
jgi:hypothetical protein